MEKITHRIKGSTRPAILITSLAIIVLGAIGSIVVYRNISSKLDMRFDERASVSATDVTARINDYADVLYFGQALLATYPDTTQAKWVKAMDTLQLFKRYTGLSSLSYIDVVNGEAEKAEYLAQKRVDPAFNADIRVLPDGVRSVYGLATLYAANSDISSVVGYDAFSDPARKQVYDKAAASKSITLSPVTELRTHKKGVFMVLPRLGINGQPVGYLLASVGVNDFMSNILSHKNTHLHYLIDDVTESDEPTLVYKSPDWNFRPSPTYTTTVRVADRAWRLQVRYGELAPPAWPVAVIPAAIMIAAAACATSLLVVSKMHLRHQIKATKK